MTVLPHRKREAYAQALAVGLSPREAAEVAGFAVPRNKTGLAKATDIKDREAEIRQSRAWGGSRDLGVLIDELAATAIKARSLNTAQGATAATRLFDLVGKYKDKLPDPPGTPSPTPAPPVLAIPVHPDDEYLSEAEWLARYGPDAPGGKLASP